MSELAPEISGRLRDIRNLALAEHRRVGRGVVMVHAQGNLTYWVEDKLLKLTVDGIEELRRQCYSYNPGRECVVAVSRDEGARLETHVVRLTEPERRRRRRRRG